MSITYLLHEKKVISLRYTMEFCITTSMRLTTFSRPDVKTSTQNPMTYNFIQRCYTTWTWVHYATMSALCENVSITWRKHSPVHHPPMDLLCSLKEVHVSVIKPDCSLCVGWDAREHRPDGFWTSRFYVKPRLIKFVCVGSLKYGRKIADNGTY